MKRRARRIVGVIMDALSSALLAATLSPLAVRGRVARWLFSRATDSLCGFYSVSDVRLGRSTLFALASGRPVHLVLRNLQVTGPDRRPVLAAQEIQAVIVVQILPLRITIVDATASTGLWRLASTSGTSLADSFRPIPAGGRGMCLRPAPRMQAPGRRSIAALRIGRLQFRDISFDLDFPD